MVRLVCFGMTWLLLGSPLPGSAEPVQVFAVGTHPTLSPGGRWIAYQLSTGAGGIEKAPINGGDPITLTTSGKEPDWSRTEKHLIVFRDKASLATVHAINRDTMRIASGEFRGSPAWSPVGSEVAVDGSIVSVPGGSVTGVRCQTAENVQCEGESVTWASFNGELWLAFAQGDQILKVPRRGGLADVVADGLGVVMEPAWSPDGKWIAFVLEDGSPDVNRHIWLISADGSATGLRQVKSGVTDDHNPAWSPRSDAIYFDRNGDGIWKYQIDAVSPNEPLTSSQDSSPPVDDMDDFIIVHVEQPKYPELALSLGIEASVVVSCFVTPEGKMEDIRIVSVTTDPPGYDSKSFELAAIEAISEWKVFPPTKGGKPIGTFIEIPVRFELEDPPRDD